MVVVGSTGSSEKRGRKVTLLFRCVCACQQATGKQHAVSLRRSARIIHVEGLSRHVLRSTHTHTTHTLPLAHCTHASSSASVSGGGLLEEGRVRDFSAFC